ncbi:MAG: metallophosphoesterase [Verrucomicrobiota bacterium]
MSHPKIRVLSDLHIGHRASLARNPDRLAPLVEGADIVIFNGDTIELKFANPTRKPETYVSKDELAKRVRSWGAEPIFVTGNHDPSISNIHHLSLDDGNILITHGDGCFKNIAPWSSESKILGEETNRLATPQTELSRKHSDLHSYLSDIKSASIEAYKRHAERNPTLWGRFSIFLHQAWPPTRPFRILRAWRDMPQASYDLARSFGLNPSLIIVGHTHRPFVRTIGKSHIVNTGSFFTWPGAYSVDFDASGTTIRKIKKSRHGVRFGNQIGRLPYLLTTTDPIQFSLPQN